MNSISSKSYRTSDSLSRYASFPYYHHEVDDAYFYCITSQLSLDTEYVLHTVKPTDTLDSLALTYYGQPNLFWIIADFNRIQDPFKKLYKNYETIKIPNMSNISFE